MLRPLFATIRDYSYYSYYSLFAIWVFQTPVLVERGKLNNPEKNRDREICSERNDCVLFVSQGTLNATVVKSSYQPKPPLTYIHVFGVALNPSSVTVNGSPITSYSFNPTTKVSLTKCLAFRA